MGGGLEAASCSSGSGADETCYEEQAPVVLVDGGDGDAELADAGEEFVTVCVPNDDNGGGVV